ncbi:squalene/phytoene synthase family protein [Nesterenkonia sp. AY15]|uniref:phytoene/squalene synthase family protein n=1 Tax=unclassified Nesterenkonia TaxID=2629769 RepID=UPI001F4C9E26|nr:squalene/phytoene synthase family protein [Nesterenkonia sp. YGD6]MCH8569890.1 squalene/phytoene synthase family protein [Nesterenkonia sp. AY15]
MSAPADPAEHFTSTARAAADRVISSYSTSFGLATRLLGPRHRSHVRSIYALVRVADEVVDGAASAAGLDPAQKAEALEHYAEETRRALARGYSTDLVVHAFARTAIEAQIGLDLIDPFFDSMRADLEPASYGAAEHASYVYGSAEVIGLMCLQVFLREVQRTPAEREILINGARALGAAFQNINFLRDLAEDTAELGRDYLDGGAGLTEAQRQAWVDTIRGQLAEARAAMPLLPRDARTAVRSACALFEALLEKIAVTPVEELYHSRVRVSNACKAGLAARSALTTRLETH